jgi:hypothetical protein
MKDSVGKLVLILVLALVRPAATANAQSAAADDASEQPQESSDPKSAASSVGFATNKSGQMEGAGVREGEEIPQWGHALPFLAQEVLDKGFHLPLPYGAAGIYAYVKQDLLLSDLRISFGDPDQPTTPVPFVTFETAYNATDSYNLKLDMWLFPFLNTYLIANKVKSAGGLVPIVVPGESILDVVVPPLGARCDDGPGTVLRPRPALCDEDVVLLDQPKYTGETFGVGIVLPIGWKNFFAAIPLSYTWTDTSNTTSTVKTFNGSLRVGYHFEPKNSGQLALYLGTTYLDTEQDIFGVFNIDTGTDVLGEIDINYTIHQSPADKWNYLAGFNWVITNNWWLQSEVGFGGSRNDFIASLTYRW